MRCRWSTPDRGELLESLAYEKTALGLYLSGHPYEAYRSHLRP